MGVQSLWSVVTGYYDSGSLSGRRAELETWDVSASRGGRDTVLIDGSVLVYASLTATLERYGAGAAIQGLVPMYTSMFNMIRNFLMTLLARGLRIVCILDGAPSDAGVREYVRRRSRYYEAVVDYLKRDASTVDDSMVRAFMGPGPFGDMVLMAAIGCINENCVDNVNDENGNRHGSREIIRGTLAKYDADREIIAFYKSHESCIAAVITTDSDMLMAGVTRVARLTIPMFVELAEMCSADDGPVSPWTMYSSESLSKCILFRARKHAEKVKSLTLKVDGGKRRVSVCSSRESSLVDTVEGILLRDVAACLGNDVGKLVREAMQARGMNVWSLIVVLLSKDARRHKWVTEDGGAQKSLFQAFGLSNVVARYDEYAECRNNQRFVAGDIECAAETGESTRVRIGGSALEAALARWKEALLPSCLRNALFGNGLMWVPCLPKDFPVRERLLRMRRALVRRTGVLPAGSVCMEMSADCSTMYVTVLVPPARIVGTGPISGSRSVASVNLHLENANESSRSMFEELKRLTKRAIVFDDACGNEDASAVDKIDKEEDCDADSVPDQWDDSDDDEDEGDHDQHVGGCSGDSVQNLDVDLDAFLRSIDLLPEGCTPSSSSADAKVDERAGPGFASSSILHFSNLVLAKLREDCIAEEQDDSASSSTLFNIALHIIMARAAVSAGHPHATLAASEFPVLIGKIEEQLMAPD